MYASGCVYASIHLLFKGRDKELNWLELNLQTKLIKTELKVLREGVDEAFTWAKNT